MTNTFHLHKHEIFTALSEIEMAPDPICQFERWFDHARHAQLPYANAMTLATVGADHRPSARIVLMKRVDARGFVFFSNYQSRKARDLAQNPHASLVFHWAELEKQVRIEGVISKTSDAESDAYFESRPLASRIGAWASEQSAVMADRRAFEANCAALAERLGEHPPRPPHWGGYRLCPHRFEFWQGQPARLHDRFQYLRDGDRWRIVQLCP